MASSLLAALLSLEGTVSVSLRSSGEREPKGHVYAEKEMDCKARPETSWRGQQAGDSREPCTRQRKLGSRLQATRQEGLSTQGVGVLLSTQASNRLHEARHCGKALCFTQSADLMLASSRNTFPDTPRGMLSQIPGQLMPRQLDT